MKGIIVHHTVFPFATPLKIIRAYHKEKRAFNDIGYHWIVVKTCAGWYAQAGREENIKGAHCMGYNDMIGVGVNGNYEVDLIEDSMIEALVNLLTSICLHHGLNPHENIYPHSMLGDTACPGKHMMRDWNYIIHLVSEQMPLKGACV